MKSFIIFYFTLNGSFICCTVISIFFFLLLISFADFVSATVIMNSCTLILFKPDKVNINWEIWKIKLENKIPLNKTKLFRFFTFKKNMLSQCVRERKKLCLFELGRLTNKKNS